MKQSSPLPSKPKDSYRLLHTADWHLGKTLNDQSREEEHTLFLEWLLTSIDQYEVDAVLLAGDVFDSANPPQSALSLYYNFVAELYKRGTCSLAVISGNHDSAALLEAPKQALRALNVHVTGTMAEDQSDRLLLLEKDGSPRLAIAMLPFLRDRDLRIGRAGESRDEITRELTTGIAQRYREASNALPAGIPAIAAGHLTVTGAKTSDAEREIHIGGLGSVTADIFPKEFSYVALGHLHRPQSAGSAEHVRYSGSPIPLSFSEYTDEKEVRVLDVTSKGITHHGLEIPLFRHLSQIHTTVASLEKDLKGFKPQSGELKAWVEVVVEDASLQDDLNEHVRTLTEKASFDVLKVLRGRTQAVVGPSAGEISDDEAIDELLSDQKSVFDLRLSQEVSLSDKELDELRSAFAELLERIH